MCTEARNISINKFGIINENGANITGTTYTVDTVSNLHTQLSPHSTQW